MPPLQENYVDRILKAKVYDVAIETPLEAAPRLSRRLNNRILFKREDLQPVITPRAWPWPPAPAESRPSSSCR
jgi:threonine dehydratase